MMLYFADDAIALCDEEARRARRDMTYMQELQFSARFYEALLLRHY